MQDRNANRPGYKKTKAGWIPNDWKVLRVKDVGAVQAGRQRSPHYTEGKLRPYLRVANIYDGYIDSSDVMQMMFTEEEFHRYRLRNGDILLNEGQSLELVGRCAKYMGVPPNCCFQNTLVRFRPDGIMQDDFCQILFTHLQKSGAFAKIASQTTSIAHLGVSRFANLRIPVPTISEQKKIAKIFSALDDVIDKDRKIITTKKNRKKALMQQLLTGKKRLPSFGLPVGKRQLFPQGWKALRAKELFKTRTKKNCENEPVLSVTQGNGVVYRDMLDRKIDNSAANLNSYKLVEPGDFVISLRSFQGGLEYSKYRGLVSPAYHVIRAVKQIDANFYKYLFKSSDFIGHLAIAVIGIRDGKQINYSDFSFLYLPYPPVKEQKAIGEVLMTADREIFILERKLRALEKQRRGLMHKLLTGEVRVKT
jgi:type I restriction enzyme S subunit